MKICNATTGQNLPEPEGAYTWLGQLSQAVLPAAGCSCILSASCSSSRGRRYLPAPESTGGSLGALEVFIVSGSGAMETRSAPALPAFLAQQRLLSEAGPQHRQSVSRKVKPPSASP